MASTNTENPACANCNKSGLAILPVRYAVVPQSIEATLPDPLGNKVKNVKLSHHRYALRVLRQGFVYLFYEKHALGSHIKWEIYSVSPTGTLWKQLSPHAINSISTEPTCSRNGHNIPASVIAIERPEKCGRVWMAFSEHAWSDETFALFEKDAEARDRRMQTFHPARWISAGGYRHGLEANESNLGHVLEYGDKAAYNALLPTAAVPQLSQTDGSFSDARLEKQTTRYPFYNRRAQTKDLIAVMKKIGEKPTGKNHTPVVVALWDAVGITHELAGFCHDVLGWLDKYQHERELELSALNAIEGLKKALPENVAAMDQHLRAGHESERKRRHEVIAARRAEAERFQEPRRSQVAEVLAIIDNWTSRNLFNDEFERRIAHADRLHEPARSTQIQKIRAQAEQYLTNRDRDNKERLESARVHAWQKYERKLDKSVYKAFQRNLDRLQKSAEKLLESRSYDLVAWLESTSLIAALTEFHPRSLVDGMVFNETIGDAIFGMNASVKGGAKLDEWISETTVTERNLLWRSIALNQQKATDELGDTLQGAQKFKMQKTPASVLGWAGYGQAALQAFTDIYAKASGIAADNAEALSNVGTTAFGITVRAVNTRGLDKIVATAGDRIFKAFRVAGLADYASEKLIQHILSIRAFVNPLDSLELIKVQAANDGIVRSQQLERLRIARTFMAADSPTIRTAQAETLKSAWRQFMSKNPAAKGSIKESRLAMLLMLIEGANFSKLISECAARNDLKSWSGLTASGLTVASILFDLASVPSKALFGAESWSHQRLKLAGSLLGCSAIVVGIVADVGDGVAAKRKGNDLLAWAYFMKVGAGVANAGLTVAQGFTCSGPLIQRLTGNAALSTAARTFGTRAAALIGFRILIMSTGAWLTLTIFAIQALIWTFSDDALDEWCSLSIFGMNRLSPEAYKTPKAQADALKKALVEIGLKPEEESPNLAGAAP